MGDFVEVQQQFIDHIRDPDQNAAPPGIEDRRMNIYRDLFFNNVNGFVSSSFPILKSLHEEDKWLALVRAFFAAHDCHSPYFADISKEFVDYLMNEREMQAEDPPFMVELAHYEWVELNVAIRHEQYHYEWLELAQLEHSPLVLSELAWPLSYSYPVHQISEDFQPEQGEPGSVHLIVYRDEDDDVQFMQINGVTAMMLQALTADPGIKLDGLLQQLIKALPQFEPQQVANGAVVTLQKLMDNGIVRRFRPAAA